MIRATSTEGDSLSVREALESGVRVLATDCVDRPEGVVLFRYNDADSLTDALQTKSVYGVKHQADGVGEIVSVYESLLDD